MSDPVTNVDIEDVLSSIRRLVSDEARPVEAVSASPPAALVLTADHRVDAPEAAPASPDMEDTVRSAARAELERAIAELEAAVGMGASDDDADDDNQEAVEVDHVDDGGDDHDDIDGQADERGDEPGDVSGDAADNMASAATQPQAQIEDAEIAADDLSAEELDWEAPIGHAVPGPIPDAQGSDDTANTNEADGQQDEAPLVDASSVVTPFIDRSLGSEAPLSAADKIDRITGGPSDDALTDGEEDTQAALSARERQDGEAQDDADHAVEAHVEATSDDQGHADNFADEFAVTGEADNAEDDHTAANDASFEADVLDADVVDDAALDADAEADPDGPHFDTPTGPFNADHDDPYPAFSTLDHEPVPEFAIDEDVLRDMVADIVRSELQGELGERITRNVRKLVRREINRALAGQDLI